MKKLEPIFSRNVELTGGIWEERNRVNREVTLPVEYSQCKRTGRLDAFKLNWKPGKPKKPHYFWDSDVAKWIEAVGLSLVTHPDPELGKKTDQVIDWIAAAQQPDGYLNIYHTIIEPDQRWADLKSHHELYCAGHLMEAAVAYYEGTGKRKLLDVMCRYADYIHSVFGRKPGQLRGYPGHEEIELALIKLYKATDEKRYLELSAFFVNERGRSPHYFDKEARRRGVTRAGRAGPKGHDDVQAHLPVRDQKTAEGHAVRAVYLYAGMADVAAYTNDKELLKACRRLWKNITERRMYIHGGIGSNHRGERFTSDFDLPNEEAYAETCASIGLVFFAHRMLHIEADARYADVMERALYNGVLSGISLDGKHFFYDNYLASLPGSHRWRGQKPPVRAEWFGCACCPPNIARLLASIGDYIYAKNKHAIYVHLYADSVCHTTIHGSPIKLTQRTGYPWKEKVCIKIDPGTTRAFSIALRIPGWCRNASVKLNGRSMRPEVRKGYAAIKRAWSPGDTIELTLPMPVERIEAHPSVRHDAGRVALQRGPIVYCIEEADNGRDLNDLALDPRAKLTVSHDKALGAPVIRTRGRRRQLDGWDNVLYRPACSRTQSCAVKAIPYHLWANRGEGEMLVWVRSEAM